MFPKRRLRGYARVSAEDQVNDAKLIELKAAAVMRFTRSGDRRPRGSRPVLAKLLGEINAGEVLVVLVRLDRLARSVSHLLAVIEQLDEKGAHFRSIDTSTPQGMFSWCGCPARTSADFRTHQSRYQRSKGARQPGFRERRLKPSTKLRGRGNAVISRI